MPATLISAANLKPPKFEPNQCGVILTGDGNFTVWSTFDNPLHPTAEQVERMEKLRGFAAALQLPEIMQVLLNVANDPAVFKQDVEFGSNGHH